MQNNIILCGYKAAGKTTIGKACSHRLNCQFIDTDRLMLRHAAPVHTSVTQSGMLYDVLGERGFRTLETRVIQALSDVKNAIIAVGGGAVVEDASVRALHALGTILYLYVDKKTLLKRLMQAPYVPHFIDKTNKAESIKRYLVSRDACYESVCDKRIDITHKTVDESVLMIEQYRGQHGK